MSTMERVITTQPQAGSTSATSHGLVYPFSSKGYIKKVYYEPETGINADNTNYQTLSVTANSTTIASRTTEITGGGTITADTPVEVSIVSGTRLSAEVEQGDVLTVATTPSGTGPAYSGRFVIVVEFTRY